MGTLPKIGDCPLRRPLRIFLIFLLRLAVIEWELICGIVLGLLGDELEVVVAERALRANRILVLIVLEAQHVAVLALIIHSR